MRKFVLSVCVFVSALISCATVSAQKEMGIFNSLGVGVGVGLTGVDVEVATPITPYLALRAGVSIMPNFSLTTGVDVDVDVDASTSGLTIPNEIDVTGSLKRTTGQVLLNVYPFPRSSGRNRGVAAHFGTVG